jgi:hypothetical protein
MMEGLGAAVLVGIVRRAEPDHRELAAKGLEMLALLAETRQARPPPHATGGHPAGPGPIKRPGPTRPGPET